MADILVVDDDIDGADVLAELLGLEGYSTRVAHDGLEGLAELDRKYPDVVLLDVEMPNLDGPSMALAMMLADLGREEIPIVLMSGYAQIDAVARKIGTPYVLRKPAAAELILAQIERAVTERIAPCPERSNDA